MTRQTVPRLRIALVTERFGRHFGGAEAYAVALAEQLRQRHDVTIVCREHAGPVDGLRVQPLSTWPGLPSWCRAWQFARRARRHTQGRYDLVHSHINGRSGDVEVVHVIPVRYRWRVQAHGMKRWLSMLSPRVLTYLHLEWQRLAPRPAHRVVAVSDVIATQLREAYTDRLAGTPLPVIAPGVHLPALAPADQQVQRHALRASLGLTDLDCLCLLVARNPLRKGLRTLLAALARLPAQYHLAVIGGHQVANQLEADDAWRGRVHFIDTTPDVSPWYTAADVYAHPTLADSFGMAPLEAMAHRLPVVISPPPWCGFAADLTHGHDAWLLPHPEDAEALAEALRTLWEQTAWREQLADTGLALARRHGWPAVAARYDALYAAVLAERRATPIP